MTDTTTAMLDLDAGVTAEQFERALTAIRDGLTAYQREHGRGYYAAYYVSPRFGFSDNCDSRGIYDMTIDLTSPESVPADRLTEKGRAAVAAQQDAQRAAELREVRGRMLALANNYLNRPRYGVPLARVNQILADAGLPGYDTDIPEGTRVQLTVSMTLYTRSTANDPAQDVRDRVTAALMGLGIEQDEQHVRARIAAATASERAAVPETETVALLAR